jgi:hypothetical protein
MPQLRMVAGRISCSVPDGLTWHYAGSRIGPVACGAACAVLGSQVFHNIKLRHDINSQIPNPSTFRLTRKIAFSVLVAFSFLLRTFSDFYSSSITRSTHCPRLVQATPVSMSHHSSGEDMIPIVITYDLKEKEFGITFASSEEARAYQAASPACRINQEKRRQVWVRSDSSMTELRASSLGMVIYFKSVAEADAFRKVSVIAMGYQSGDSNDPPYCGVYLPRQMKRREYEQALRLGPWAKGAHHLSPSSSVRVEKARDPRPSAVSTLSEDSLIADDSEHNNMASRQRVKPRQ